MNSETPDIIPTLADAADEAFFSSHTDHNSHVYAYLFFLEEADARAHLFSWADDNDTERH
jgi:hypothetical protein